MVNQRCTMRCNASRTRYYLYKAGLRCIIYEILALSTLVMANKVYIEITNDLDLFSLMFVLKIRNYGVKKIIETIEIFGCRRSVDITYYYRSIAS